MHCHNLCRISDEKKSEWWYTEKTEKLVQTEKREIDWYRYQKISTICI